MDKNKFKSIGQLVLDVLTAVWLIILTFLGSSCISSGGDVSADIKGELVVSPPAVCDELDVSLEKEVN